MLFVEREKEKINLQMFSYVLNFETKLSPSWQDLVRRRFRPKSRQCARRQILFVGALSLGTLKYKVPANSAESGRKIDPATET